MRKELIPVRWYINGRTALRNRPNRREDIQRAIKGGGATGSYTMRRTWRKAKGVLSAQGKAGKHLHMYLVTHTMPAEYSNEERRHEWRRFLDAFRKLNPVNYVWVTEVHTGGGAAVGRIHHHMVASFSSTWWYTAQARRWSWAYSGSPNGIDIRRVRRGAAGYLSKYLCKGLFEQRTDLLPVAAGTVEVPSLPFRWWGYSGVPTTGITWVETHSLDWCAFSTKWYNATYLWVPGPLAAAWAAHAILSITGADFAKVNARHSRSAGNLAPPGLTFPRRNEG